MKTLAPEQADLFSILADHHKEAAIKQAAENANEAWINEALEAIHKLCTNCTHFDLDDVADLIGMMDVKTHEARAIGPLMRRAKFNGWCQQSGITTSKRPSRHGGYIAQYRSLIFSPHDL